LPGRERVARAVDYATFAPCPPAVWRFFLDCTGSTPVAAFAQRADLLHRVDLRPVLGTIRQPVLLVCGDRDPLVGPGCHEDLLNGLPNARRVEVTDCGHYPQYTHPQVLADVVRPFLTPPAAGS
jgi:pimeloyl-ACP methyl ester carboxylesterase